MRFLVMRVVQFNRKSVKFLAPGSVLEIFVFGFVACFLVEDERYPVLENNGFLNAEHVVGRACVDFFRLAFVLHSVTA